MAIIPRYISDAPAPAGINQVKADPNLAAAPYRAAEQSTSHLFDVVQGELGAWGKVLAQKEAEQKAAEQKNARVQNSLYQAEAMANLSIQANQAYQQMSQTADGTKNIAHEFDAQFQKLADMALVNAPSKEAQLGLAKKLIPMRTQYYNKASNHSIALTNQVNMNRMESTLGQYEAMAAANPSAAQEILNQSKDIFDSMSALGVPEVQRQKIQEKFTKNLGYHTVRAEIEKDPIAVQQKMSEGLYSELGQGYVTALQNYAKSTEGAYKAQASRALKSLEQRIYEGQPIPENYSEMLSTGHKYGLSEQSQQINRLLELNKATANASPTELLSVAAQLKQAAASGELNAEPKQLGALVKFLEGNSKALEEDGLTYAQLKGGMAPPKPIDLLSADEASLEERRFRTEQVKAAYSVSTPALTKTEAGAAAEQLLSAVPDQASKIIGNLNALGPDTARAVASALSKKDPGLAIAVASGINNEELVSKIIQGKAVLSSGAIRQSKEELTPKDMGIFSSDPSKQKAYIEAAHAIKAYEHSKGRAVSIDDAFEEAASIISVDRPGTFHFGKYKTQAPVPGMSSSEFEAFVDRELMNDSVWKSFGNGRPTDSTNQPIQWNRVKPSDMSYHSLGDGNYEVMYDDQPVMSENGQPLKINLRRLASNN